ncbi:thioredoxin domain-containing protein [Iamia sp.]|uniref:thioredoxin domain-containing protein n=1 Tax=Iamia sp. TaxID=2722710 RepID=UPI002D7FE839|nr:thioredoxin domain-containing protein [Iamia sp.]
MPDLFAAPTTWQPALVERVLLLVALGGVAVAIAALLRARTRPDPPTRPAWAVPDHVERTDFAHPETPWLVAVFSSSTCTACRSTWEKARPLASDEVAVLDIDAVEGADLHQRYGIDAVPLLLVVDADGAVRSSFLGEPPTADLWSVVAELRAGDAAAP